MMLKLLRKLLVCTLLSLFCANAQSATMARFLTGTKSQTFSKNSQEQIGGSPLGLLVFVDFEIMKKTYFSMGTSFELSTASYSTSGFSLYGSVLYYFYGEPKALVSTDEVTTSMELYQKYSIYGNLGIFQKEIRIRDPEDDDLADESLGGILLGLGGNYNISKKIYLNGHIQLLNSGLSTKEEYSSFEFYVGLGLRI